MPPVKKTKISSSFPRTLTIAGYSILTFGIFSFIIALSNFGFGSEQMLLRIGQATSSFPLLFIGIVLTILGKTYSARTSLNTSNHLFNVVKILSLLFTVLYFVFIPLAFISLNTIYIRDQNAYNRVVINLENRKAEIIQSINMLDSKQQLTQALLSFPEISNVNLSPSDDIPTVRAGIIDSITKAIKAQSEKVRQDIIGRRKAILSSTLSSAFLCLIATIAFSGITSEILPLYKRFFLRIMSPLAMIWKPLIGGMGLAPNHSDDASPARTRRSKSHRSSQISHSDTLMSEKSTDYNIHNSDMKD